MNPGELKDLVEIYTSEKIKENGIVSTKYKFISRLKVKKKNNYSKNFISNDSTRNATSFIFIAHRRNFLKKGNFVKYEDEYYKILDINPFDDRIYTQIVTELVK